MHEDVRTIPRITSPIRPLTLRVAAWTVCASALACARASAQAITPLVSTRIEYRVQPFVDMYFTVRDAASTQVELPKIDGLDKAAEAARALDGELGSPLAWGPIEGLLPECENAAAARAVFGRLPETFEFRGGKTVALRAAVLKLADALAVLEPAFQKEIWPAHQAAITDANQRIATGFTPKESVALEFMTKSFQFTDDGPRIPVYLVARMPFPGAVTQRDDEGRGVCFVAIDGVKGSQLYETVLHEVIHAYDVASKDKSVLATLRKSLEAQGLTPRDREWRDVPHTLMFVQAGETIRRVIDPAHKHYGEAFAYYDKVRAIADLELETWKRHLDGQLDLDAALDKIVTGATATRKAK